MTGWEVGRSSSLGTPDTVAAPSECGTGGLSNKRGREEHLLLQETGGGDEEHRLHLGNKTVIKQ